MTLPIERARSRRPITWLTVIGAILLPVVIGGILVAALYNPSSRLDSMHAAIVNNDQPVTINGQIVPLGRQLTAGLVKGSNQLESNLVACFLCCRAAVRLRRIRDSFACTRA